MRKNRGFTLVELLITIVVLGIIVGLTFPMLRNMQLQNEKQKYETYAEGMVSSARVYVDSYDEDLFGHHDTGCAYIPYKNLVEKDLLKDISITNVTCDTDHTFVRVVKIKGQYAYAHSIECREDTTTTFAYPEGEGHTMNPEICRGREGANILVETTPSEGYSRRKKTKVILSSATGIHADVVIYGAWIKGENNRPNETTEWKRVNFEITGNQEEKILNGEIIQIESEDFVTDSNKQNDGSYYLWIRVDELKDIYGEDWKNPNEEEGNYVRGTEFKVDNTPPVCTYHGESTTWSTGSRTVTWGCKDVGEGASGCTVKEGEYENIEQKYGSYTFPTSAPMKSQKTYPFPTYTIKDVAGNSTVCQTRAANIYIDNTVPKCVDTIPTAWTSQNRTITWGCTDEEEGSGCQKGNGTWGTHRETYGSRAFTTDTEKVTPSPVRTYVIKDNVGHEVTCDVSRKLTADGSLPVFVDKTTPTISAKQNPISMGAVDYDFKDNVNVTFGRLGGTVTCDPARSKKTGVYDVTCTAKNRSNLSKSVTFKAQHSYPATAYHYSCCTQWGTCKGCSVCGITCCNPPGGSTTFYECCKQNGTCTSYSCPKGGTLRGVTCHY